MSENNTSTGIQSRMRIASAELAASMTSKPAARRLVAVTDARENVVFYDQHNRSGGRLLLQHGLLEALLVMPS
jgi:hypothetical protein